MPSPRRARAAAVVLGGLLALAGTACTQCRENETYVSVRDVWGNATGDHVCVPTQRAPEEEPASNPPADTPPPPRFVDPPPRDAGRAADASQAVARAGTCFTRDAGTHEVTVVRRTGTLPPPQQEDGGSRPPPPDGDYRLVQVTAYAGDVDAFRVRSVRASARLTGGYLEVAARVATDTADPADESFALVLRGMDATLVCTSPGAVLAAALVPTGVGRGGEGSLEWVDSTRTLRLVVRTPTADVELFLVPETLRTAS